MVSGSVCVSQEAAGLPWVVGLDLTGTNMDMFNLAPALALKKLEPPEDEEQAQSEQGGQESTPSYYLCLSADNRQAECSQSTVTPLCFFFIYSVATLPEAAVSVKKKKQSGSKQSRILSSATTCALCTWRQAGDASLLSAMLFPSCDVATRRPVSCCLASSC